MTSCAFALLLLAASCCAGDGQTCDSSLNENCIVENEEKPEIFKQHLGEIIDEVNNLPTLKAQDEQRVQLLMNALDGKEKERILK